MKKSYKTRGQGFTLIELLAVLVVLAILALIAIPIVIKVINNAREDSYKRSIEGYARAVEMGLARWAMANPGVDFPTELTEEFEKSYVDYKGDKVKCDSSIEVDSDKGTVNLKKCQVMKDEKKAKSGYYDYIKGEIQASGSTTAYELYNVGDTFIFGGAGYHVIAKSETNQEDVLALKDNSLTGDEITSLGFSLVYTENGYGMVFFDNIDPKTSEYNQSNVKKIVDVWAKKLPNGVIETRLLKIEELMINELGYELDTKSTSLGYVSTERTPSWIYNGKTYFTMTPYQDSTSFVWIVDGNSIGNGHVNSPYSVRPVINVLKSAITKN